MSYWMASEQAITALKGLSDSLKEKSDELTQLTNQLEETFTANQSGLGAHNAKIKELIQEMREIIGEEAQEPIKVLRKTLLRSARAMAMHLKDDSYVKGGGGRSR